MQSRPVPFFYIGPESHDRMTVADRVIMTCVILLTLTWSAIMVWLACNIGMIIAHFVVHLIPPALPFRPTIGSAALAP